MNQLKKKIYSVVLKLFGYSLPDKLYLKLIYYKILGKNLNLHNPQTFNEKLQWLKLHNRKSEFTIMADKIEAKKWVAERIGIEYIIPTIGIWDNVSDIDINILPNQFVLKTNHDSGAIIICRNKENLDLSSVIQRLEKSQKRNYYKLWREWPYKDINRKILAEELMVDESGFELKDYKIFCFNGKPEFIQVDFNRFTNNGHKRNLYSVNWELLNCECGYPSEPKHEIPKPVNLSKMLELASTLSSNCPFLRVDFYVINETIKFGEMTFYPGAGFEEFTPNEWNMYFGNLIKIKNP